MLCSIEKLMRSVLALLILAALFACGQKQEEHAYTGRKLLGSFEGHYNAKDGTLTISPVGESLSGNKVASSQRFNPLFALGSDDSLELGRGTVVSEECGSANWNPSTKVITFNLKVRNKSDETGDNETYLAPEWRMTGVYANTPAYLIEQLYTNLPEQGCPNPATLTNCDTTPATGHIKIYWPTDTTDYTDDPGRDLSLLLGADNELTPGESTSCDPMQMKLSSETSFGFYYDVLGWVKGEALDPPTVDPITSPTNNLDPTFNITLSGGADAVRMVGGDAPYTCTDDNVGCDADPTTGVINLTYTLTANTTQNVSVFQQITTPFSESAARVVNIEHDAVAPLVTSLVPANGAVSISPATNILVNFDDGMETASLITNHLSLNRDGGSSDCSSLGAPQGVTLTYPSAQQVLLTPTSTLAQNEIYCVTIAGLDGGTCDGAGEVRDQATNCMVSTYTSIFTTSNSDSTPPVILSTVPTDGANGVSRNTSVQVVFNEAMNASTVTNASFFIVATGGTPIAGTRTLSTDQKTVTFTPSSILGESADIDVTVTTDVEDLAGNALASQYTSSFTTGSGSDGTPPEVAAVLPEDQATEVNENVQPQVTFTEPMNPSTINTTNITIAIKEPFTAVPASVSLSPDGLTATIVPINQLINGETYLITIQIGCQDVALNPLVAPVTSEFEVTSDDDETPPTITQITPADNTSDVSVYSGVVIVFSEAIDPNTVHTGTFIVEDLSSDPPTIVPGNVTVAIDGLSATFTQTSPPLDKNEDFLVTLKGGTDPCTTCIKDLEGLPMVDDFESNFTTEFQDNDGPTVVVIAPGNGASGIPSSANIIIGFSEPISESTVTDNNIYLTIPPDTTHVAGELKLLVDGQNVKFNPTNNLSASTYQVNVTASVKDLAGRGAIAATDTFTSSGSADIDGPAVTTTTPADGATNVSRWENILVNFNETIDPNTVTASNIELVLDGTSEKIPAQLSVDDDADTIVINPVNLLANNATYSVNIKPGLRNVSGFSLPTYTSFGFTTIDNFPRNARTYSVIYRARRWCYQR